MKPAPKKMEKPKTAERQKSILLTPIQKEQVDAVLDGKTKTMPKSKSAQLAIAEARKELSSAAQLSRADVIDGFLEAINLARLGADPASMIRGWTEIGKMLGHYAPEIKKVEITDPNNLGAKMRAMTDAELLEIIEGECKHVD